MDNELSVIKFEAANIPKPTESIEKTNEKYVSYGVNNLYPNYLLRLYNESSIHQAIINSKADYIIGDGLKYTGGEKLSFKVNAADNIEEFIGKAIKDYLIFNYFCVEVEYSRFNKPIGYYFIPAHKIRTNNDKTMFWFNNDFRYKKGEIIRDRWKVDNTSSSTKIFFFDGYNPSLNNVYPLPDYSGCIRSIENDIAIKEFNLNNIKNHFLSWK
jgi:hypothetical protein